MRLGRILRAAHDPRRSMDILRERAGGKLSYQLGNGSAGRPAEITLYMTRHCNLRCKMCDLWGESGTELRREKSGADPSMEDLKRTIDAISPSKPAVLLFGGEPLLYRNFGEALGYLADRGIRTRIITNGTLLARYARDHVRLGVESVTISVDGPPEVHDEIRGVKGTFARLTEGVRRLHEAKTEMGSKAPTVMTLTTISEMNLHALGQMVDVLQDLPLDRINLQQVMSCDEATLRRHNEEFSRVFGQESPSWEGFLRAGSGVLDVRALTRQIADLKRRRSPVPIEFLPEFSDRDLERYYTDMTFSSRGYCRAPWFTASILPNGDVTPCLDYVFGNLRDEEFSAIWNGERARRFRLELKRAGRFPICSRCCILYRY